MYELLTEMFKIHVYIFYMYIFTVPTEFIFLDVKGGINKRLFCSSKNKLNCDRESVEIAEILYITIQTNKTIYDCLLRLQAQWNEKKAEPSVIKSRNYRPHLAAVDIRRRGL